GNLFAAPALDMVIQATNDRGVGRQEGPHEQAQQDTTERVAGPFGSIEHPMIVLELGVLAQAQHAQGCRDRAFAGCENGTDEQDFGPLPDPFAKDQLKVSQDSYTGCWQVAHGSPLLSNRV